MRGRTAGGHDILGGVEEDALVEEVDVGFGRHEREAGHVFRAEVDFFRLETQLGGQPELELADGREGLGALHACHDAETVSRRCRVDEQDAALAHMGHDALGEDLCGVALEMVEVEHVEARRDGVGVAPPLACEGGLPRDGGQPFLGSGIAVLEVGNGFVDGLRMGHLGPPLQRQGLGQGVERLLKIYFH